MKKGKRKGKKKKGVKKRQQKGKKKNGRELRLLKEKKKGKKGERKFMFWEPFRSLLIMASHLMQFVIQVKQAET